MARILLYSVEHPTGDGGLNRTLMDLHEALIRDGHEVLRLHPSPHVHFEGMRLSEIDLDYPNRKRPFKASADVAASVHRLALRFRSFQPDVVNVHYLDFSALYVALVARLHRVPVVASAHGSDLHDATSFSTSRRVMLRRIASLSGRVTAPSERLQREYLSVASKALKGSARVAHLGTDLEYWASGPEKADGGGTLRILAIGSLRRVKGFDLLIDAMSLLIDCGLQSVSLQIVGSGPEFQALKNQCERLGISESVSFLGRLDRDSIRSAYAASDLFVLSSRAESGPLVVLEALASGLPVVATDVGAVGDFLGGSPAGCIVPQVDAANLAAGVATLQSRLDALGVAEMYRLAVDRASRFPLDRMTATYARAILDCT